MKLWARKCLCHPCEKNVEQWTRKQPRICERFRWFYSNMQSFIIAVYEEWRILKMPDINIVRSLCRQLQFTSKLKTTCLCMQTAKVVQMLQLQTVNTLQQTYPKPFRFENIEQLTEKYDTNTRVIEMRIFNV